MRTLEEVQRLLAYNRWAHRAFFDAALRLPPGAVDRALPSSFPSIRATLAHMVGAERIWVIRWEGGTPELPPGWDDESVEGIRAELARVELRQDAVLAALSPAALGRELEYGDRAGVPHRSTFGDMFVHVVNHATYHRGQLATLFRGLGEVPPTTDFIKFTRSRVP